MYHRGASTFISGSTPILPPDTYFYIVRAGVTQVGVASITIDTLSDGVQVIERLGLDLPLHTTSSRSQYLTQYTLGSDLRLRDFRVTIPGKTTPVVQQGVIEGDSMITLTPGTGEPRWRLPPKAGALIPPLAAPVVMALQQKLQAGERMSVPVFDPMTLGHDTITLTVLDDSVFHIADSAEVKAPGGPWVPAHADTLRGWKLNWSNRNQATQMWVDVRGLPLQFMTPAGYSMERSAFEIVTINYRRQRAARPAVRDSEVVLRTAIGAGVEPTQNVENLRVRLRAPEAGLRLPADRTTHQWQHMDGDVVVALVPSLDSLNPGQLSEFALQPWLEDAPHLGLADSTIGNRARSVAGEDPDPRARVARLVRWVSENIRRVADPVVPRAATVLRERQADVDGHTLLFVALARSIGLPARPVSGILLAGDRFYLHSWAEVYVGGWIPVEPTWGEFPATANRIRLSSGTLARATDLLPQLAGLDVELLTLTQRP